MNFLVNLSLILAHSVIYEIEIELPRVICGEFKNGEGDPPPQGTYETTRQMLEAFTQYLPQLIQGVNAQTKPTAQAQLSADEAVSPGYAALQNQLYKKYGPEANKIGSDISSQNMLAQARNENATLVGPGGDLAKNALSLERTIDPEFFNQRGQLDNSLSRLQNSIDLDGNLGGGSRAEIERSLNRDNSSKGNDNPSNINTVQNALRFGQAGEARKNQQQQALTSVINIGAGYLPASRAGIDPLQVAIGRSSSGNTGDQRLQANQQGTGANANQTANNFLGQIGQFSTQRNDIESRRRDSLDRTNETLSSLPSD